MSTRFRPPSRFAFVAAACLCLGFVLYATARSLRRRPVHPNVVVVLSDALRAASLPLYGYRRDTAPRLAELARESIVFDHHLVHYPGTTVSVSQLHSGRLMAPLLINYKYIAVPTRAVPGDLLVLPQAFHDAGYRTGLVTSHYWFRDDSPLVRRFESTAIVPATDGRSYAFFEELWPAITTFLDGAEHDRRPFFLYLHTLDTHGPNEFHPGFDGFRDAADWPEAYNRYDSEILYTDHWLGRLVDDLRRRGLLEETIVVFTGDHGDQFNELGPEPWNANHGPLADRVLMHVPLVMRLPARTGTPPGGRRYTSVTRHIDLAPTLLRLAVPNFDFARYRLDGEDLSGELRAGGTGAGIERTSVSYTPRFWGIYRRDLELHYDQWNDVFSPLLRPVPDARNFPRLEVVDDPAVRAELEASLRQEHERRRREFFDLPENPDLPSPAMVGLTLAVDPDSTGRMTFEDRADDDRWATGDNSLDCRPGERPKPLTLVTPWVSGTYRVSIVLSRRGLTRNGYANRFGFKLSGDDAVRKLQGADAAGTELDAGVHRLGNRLEITFQDPEGGVSVAGLKMYRLDRPALPTVAADEEVRERLRRLGYGE